MDRTAFRPHRKLLALGAIFAVVVAGSTTWFPRPVHDAERRLTALRQEVRQAERDADDVVLGLDAVAYTGVHVVQGVAVAPPEEFLLDYDRFSTATGELEHAVERLDASTEGIVDAEVVDRAVARLADYRRLTLETFPVDELDTYSLEETARRIRAISTTYEDARTALLDVRAEVHAEGDARVTALVDDLAALRRSMALTGGAVATVVVVATVAFALRARRYEQEIEREERRRHRARRRDEFETRLHRGLEMADDEARAFDLIGPALAEALPEHPAELLLADSSLAHFHRAATTSEEPQCRVGGPSDCPAASRGQTLVFETSTAIDVCPHLKGRGSACSAVCVPVNVGGNAVGVIHVPGPDGAPLGEDAVRDVEVVGRRTSERLTVLRAFAQSEAQASTDPLTGLLNRRSLEARVRELTEADGSSYAVAYGDLDRFKLLNDVHGHEGGDRALRLFAGILRDSVRPTDVPARYGGEEFVVVLPDCGADEAMRVMQRVRERLAASLRDGRVPPFTVSFGIATSTEGEPFHSVLNAADQALLAAKQAGRDRVLLATPAA